MSQKEKASIDCEESQELVTSFSNPESGHHSYGTTSELNPLAGPDTDAENSNKNQGDRCCRPCLRLGLFSPFKWKEDACWFSPIHFFVFLIHIAKIVVLSLYIDRIGTCRAGVSTIANNRYVALHHLLLEHWDIGMETPPYPPAHGTFAVYTVDDLRSGINYTVSQFFNAENEAAGHFKRTKDDNITISIQYYTVENKGRIVKKICLFVPDVGLTTYTNEEGQTVYVYNVTEDLHALGLHGILKSVFEVKMMFSLHAVRVDFAQDSAVCHRIKGDVLFHDYDQDGQLVLDLIINHFLIECAELGLTIKGSHQCINDSEGLVPAITALVIITLVWDALQFVIGFGAMSWACRKDKCVIQDVFLNIQWLLIISIVGDVFCFIGVSSLRELDGHVIKLGFGYPMVVLSILRFFRIHHKFSVLFKTIQRSAPDVIFFMICIVILFLGFWLSAFIVLGPYNPKFSTKSSAFETFFALINSDEVYATLEILDNSNAGDSNGIWVFSRVIIVLYVSLFTVFAFNLLIALFNNAYETVKEEYQSKTKKRESTISDVSVNRHIVAEAGQSGSRRTTEDTAESSRMKPSLIDYMWSDVDEKKGRCTHICPFVFKCPWPKCCKP